MTDETLRKLYHRKYRNLELALREFESRKIVLESRPSKVLVELTENCNFRCVMCLQSHHERYARYDPALNMELGIFDRIANELFDDAYFVDLRGQGETTILPYWPDIIDRLEHYPLINWHLVTNLSLPRDATWDKMMKCGFMLGLSIDGATKETFESIRVRSHFERVLGNLELVSDALKRYRRGHLYFIVTVQTKNVHELPAIVELAHRHAVTEVQFKMVHGEYHSEVVKPKQMKELGRSLERSLELAVEYGIQLTLNDGQFMVLDIDGEKVRMAASRRGPRAALNWPPPAELDPEFSLTNPWQGLEDEVYESRQVLTHQRCFKPISYAYITSNGQVGTCNHMMSPSAHAMGDLKQQSFAEIWNGDYYRFFRASLLYNRPYDERCKWCFKHRLED